MASSKNASYRLLCVVGLLLLCMSFICVNGQSSDSAPVDAPASEPGDETTIRTLEQGIEGPAEAVASEIAEDEDHDDMKQADTDDLDEVASPSLTAADVTESGAFEVT